MTTALPAVLRTRDANRLVGADQVRWMVTSGRWQRPAKGVVVRHSGPLTATQRQWVELLVQHPSAALAGLTAAALDGLTGFPSRTLFVLIPHQARPRTRPNVLVTRSRSLTPDDIHPARSPRRTRIARSVVDAASWTSTDLRCQAILAASVQQGLVSPHSLGVCVDRMNKIRHRALIVETVRDVSGGSLSEYEVLFLRLCRQWGLPRPARQRRRKDASGRSRYLDVDFDDYRLVVEIDGQQHMEALAWWEDMMRDNEIVVDDRKEVLRFAGFALRHQSDRIAAVLLRFFNTRTPRAPGVLPPLVR